MFKTLFLTLTTFSFSSEGLKNEKNYHNDFKKREELKNYYESLVYKNPTESEKFFDEIQIMKKIPAVKDFLISYVNSKIKEFNRIHESSKIIQEILPMKDLDDKIAKNVNATNKVKGGTTNEVTIATINELTYYFHHLTNIYTRDTKKGDLIGTLKDLNHYYYDTYEKKDKDIATYLQKILDNEYKNIDFQLNELPVLKDKKLEESAQSTKKWRINLKNKGEKYIPIMGHIPTTKNYEEYKEIPIEDGLKKFPEIDDYSDIVFKESFPELSDLIKNKISEYNENKWWWQSKWDQEKQTRVAEKIYKEVFEMKNWFTRNEKKQDVVEKNIKKDIAEKQNEGEVLGENMYNMFIETNAPKELKNLAFLGTTFTHNDYDGLLSQLPEIKEIKLQIMKKEEKINEFTKEEMEEKIKEIEELEKIVGDKKETKKIEEIIKFEEKNKNMLVKEMNREEYIDERDERELLTREQLEIEVSGLYKKLKRKESLLLPVDNLNNSTLAVLEEEGKNAGHAFGKITSRFVERLEHIDDILSSFCFKKFDLTSPTSLRHEPTYEENDKLNQIIQTLMEAEDKKSLHLA